MELKFLAISAALLAVSFICISIFLIAFHRRWKLANQHGNFTVGLYSTRAAAATRFSRAEQQQRRQPSPPPLPTLQGVALEVGQEHLPYGGSHYYSEPKAMHDDVRATTEAYHMCDDSTNALPTELDGSMKTHEDESFLGIGDVRVDRAHPIP